MYADPADVNTTTREPSEFGSGIVVCLAKFSEHLWNEQYQSITRSAWWEKLDEAQREAQRREAATYPTGDAARRLMAVSSSMELSERIWMWMNGASDQLLRPRRERARTAQRVGRAHAADRPRLH